MRRLLNHPLLPQITCFGIVGALAALVNISIVIFLVESFNLQPLVANIFAFLIAFLVSFFGHRHFTFSQTKKKTKTDSSIFRFFLVASLSFLLNEGLFYIFLHLAQLNYIVSLVIVLLIVPPFTFVLSKLWAFK